MADAELNKGLHGKGAAGSASVNAEFEKFKAEGNELYKQGKYKEAEERYKCCIKIDPEKAAVYTNRALCRLKLDQNKNAEDDCNQALLRDPENVKAYYRRAAARKAQRKYAESIDDLKKLLEIEPSNEPAKKELEIVLDIFKQKLKAEGDDLFKKKKYSDAVERFTSWIKVDPTEAIAFTNRALCYLELKEFKKAEQDCDSVIQEIDPENEDAYFRRMLARKAQSNFSGSDEDWSKLYTLIENSQFHRKSFQITVMELDHVIPLEPAHLRELLEQSIHQEKYHKIYYDGDDFYEKNMYEEAKKCYTACLEMLPNHPATLIKRARCYVQLDQNEDAERDCNDTLASDPENAGALFWRAMARKGLENFTGSKDDLEKVLELNELYDEARMELDEVKDLIIYFKQVTESKSPKCSMCKAVEDVPPKIQTTPPLSTKGVLVHIGNTAVSFDEATVFYIDQYFPQWHTRTYRVPAGHFHEKPEDDHKILRDLKTDKKQKSTALKTKGGKSIGSEGNAKKTSSSSDIKTERDGSNAVESIVQLLDEWGNHGDKQPMFILKDYEFRYYLKNTCLDLKLEKGDHDILVIHRRFGILAIQVKCSEKEKELSKAYKQACKDERIFRQMNDDLYFAKDVKFTKAIAMTEMNDRSKFLKLLCNTHKSTVLTKSQLNLNDLKKWLAKIGFVHPHGSEAFTADQYRLIVGRYVGLASTVPHRTLPEATMEARGRVECLQLNPEQLKILQSENNLLLIQGASGTGKTFLLVQKAIMMAKQRRSQVYIILLNAINEITSHLDIEPRYQSASKCAHFQLRNHIKYLISMFDDTLNNLHVICEHTIRQKSDKESFPKKQCLEHYVKHFMDLFVEGSERGDKVIFDFFFDEVPRKFLEADMVSPLHLFKYSEFFAGKSSPGVQRAKRCGGLRTLWIAKTADQPCLRKPSNEVKNPYTPFAVETISRCVRLTKANFEFVKAIVTNYKSIENDMHRISGCRLLTDYFPGNAIQGTKPLYTSIELCEIHTECDEDKIQDNPEMLVNPCLVSRLKKKLKVIFERLTPINCPVHILVNEDFFGLLKGPKKSNIKDVVGDACVELGCNVTGLYVPTFLADEQDAVFEDVDVRLMNYEPFVGCESEILIAVIDNYSLVLSDPINLLGMLSRVLGQLVIVRLPQNGPKSLKLERPFERACISHTLKI